MNLKGLDYNTQRERLVLPEYGREIQQMVDYCKQIANRHERQICAENIVEVMARLSSQKRPTADMRHKLWDHLAMMSNFELDIDYPFDVREARTMSTKPQPIAYPAAPIPVRHYGKMLFEVFEKLKSMPPGEERDELVRLAANQMKRDLATFGHGSDNAERIAADLEHLTDGKVGLDLSKFKFEKTAVKTFTKRQKRRK